MLQWVSVIALGVGAFFVFRGDDGPTQTTFASQLSELCVDARTQVEALGQPSEIPISKLYPGTVKIGRAFLEQARALDPPPEQAAAAKTFLEQRRCTTTASSTPTSSSPPRTTRLHSSGSWTGRLANLGNAETAAKTIGAPECALRPFE